MATYPRLTGLAQQVTNGSAPNAWNAVVDYLQDIWLDDYSPVPGSKPDIVETSSSNFSYLFDVGTGRLIAAYGVSHGKHTGARPASRMAGHPLGGPKGYHRGHAIPHTLGGATDINLVPQLGSVNVGPFRELERAAVATPGAFYFTYWRYPTSNSQRPIGVDQGLCVPGQPARVNAHGN
jgi:hypothetical protein